MAKGYYGNAAGPASKMYAYVEFRTTTQEEGRAWVQLKRSCLVEGSGFGGTVVDRSWGSRMQLYGPGWYGDSGWVDYGWVAYGGTARASATVSYTGASGAYYASSVDASYSPDVPTWQPRSVTSVSASIASGAAGKCMLRVSWASSITVARPYSGIYVDISADGGDYSLAKDCSGSDTSCTLELDANHVYQARVLPHNGAGNAPAHQYTAKVYTKPDAPKRASASRISDAEVVVSIEPGSSYSALYSGHQVQRRVDGGAWSSLGSIGGASKAYRDRSTSANHSYSYRVASSNAAGQSAWTETGVVYTTPAAPGKPRMARVSDTRVTASFDNPANTATACEIERSTDGVTWAALRTVAGRATGFEDEPGGGTFYYRVRNTRGSLRSAWAYSDGIVTICAPAAPSITSPSSSQVIPMTQPSITMAWKHNPIDGSAQTAAQCRWSSDGGSTWSSIDVTGARESATIPNSFSLNIQLTVQVRTKGAHADYGPWSAAVGVYVRQVPTVTIEEPADGFTIENTPVRVRIAYSDPSGAMAAGTLTVRDDDGGIVYSRDLMDGLEFEVASSDWLPRDGSSYTMDASVRSSSTLQGSATRRVSVSYVLPSIAVADAVPDPETGFVTVTLRELRSDSAAPMASCSLWRNVGGVRTLLGEGLPDGARVIDRYAPLNIDYSYETASFAESGAASEASFPGRFRSDHLFAYWSGGVARGKYNASDSISVDPAFETFEIAGKPLPVIVARNRFEESHDMSVKLRSREEALAFYKAVRSCEPMVFKTLYGFVFHGMASAKLEPSLSDAEGSWEVSMCVTRIWGEQL